MAKKILWSDAERHIYPDYFAWMNPAARASGSSEFEWFQQQPLPHALRSAHAQ